MSELHPIDQVEGHPIVKKAGDTLIETYTLLEATAAEIDRLLSNDGDPRKLASKLAEAFAMRELLTIRAERQKEQVRAVRRDVAQQVASRLLDEAYKLEVEAGSNDEKDRRRYTNSRWAVLPDELKKLEKAQEAQNLRLAAEAIQQRYK